MRICGPNPISTTHILNIRIWTVQTSVRSKSLSSNIEMAKSLTSGSPLQTFHHQFVICSLIDQSLRDFWNLLILPWESSLRRNYKSCKDLGFHEGNEGVLENSLHQKRRQYLQELGQVLLKRKANDDNKWSITREWL